MREKFRSWSGLTQSKQLRACLLFFGIGGAILLGSFYMPALECSRLQTWIVTWGPWAPFYFFLLYVAATLGLLPGVVLTLAAGMVFGVWAGTLLVLAGATVGAMLAFLIARFLMRDTIEVYLRRQSWFPRFAERLAAKGFAYILFARLVPIFPFTGLNFASGVLPIRWQHYLFGSVLGMIPGTFAYVYLGESGCKLIDPLLHGDFSLGSIPPEARRNALLSLALLAGLTMLPLFMGRGPRKKSQDPAA